MNFTNGPLSLDPLRPWSQPLYGTLALAGVALLLVGLTIWTYRGLTGRRRVFTLVLLRLTALLIALVVVLRPSLAFREHRKTPFTLLIALDASQSMTIQDAHKGQARWQELLDTLKECQPHVQRLREEDVTVHVVRFAGEVSDFEPDGQADGKRSDYGDMMRTLAERFGQDRNLRGLLVVGDGADNGSRHDAVKEAKKWGCPIYTFTLGKPTTTSKQNDLLVRFKEDPPSVPVKDKLTVKALLDAPGFLNPKVRLHLFIDDREVAIEDAVLTRTQDNEVTLATDAPSRPGEVKVTLRAEPLPGEVTTANNEISTYVTITKEGIKVLLVDKPRFPEPQLIVDALRTDRRFIVSTLWLRSDQPSPRQAELFRFDKEHYDVIILGDVSVKRLTGGQTDVLPQIENLVKNKGTGLLMMAGYETLGNGMPVADWRGTVLEQMSPVEFNGGGQIDQEVRLRPTASGLEKLGYVLKLSGQTDEDKRFWEQQLPPLTGMTKLGEIKKGAFVLAESTRADPMLALQNLGEGRVLAFAADTTYNWRQLGQPDKDDGLKFHAAFWKHMIIWLAKQEDAAGNVEVIPRVRRLAAGTKLGFDVKLKSKDGGLLPGGRLKVKAIGPDGVQTEVPTAQENNVERGSFWKTDAVGEYRLVVEGQGKDRDGTDVQGTATARFVVYQDDAELLRQAADEHAMRRLAEATANVQPPRGPRESQRAFLGDELPRFLEKLSREAQQQTDLTPAKPLPDWRSRTRAEVPAGVLLAFTAVLCMEWFLRRRWGLV